MKKILSIIIVVLLVFAGIYQYMRVNTYSYHLDKAKIALEKIEAIVSGETIPVAIVPMASADSDSEKIIIYARVATDEIGIAQGIVDNMNDLAKKNDAQNVVSNVKNED